MKQILLEESINFVDVEKLSTAFLKMLDPVQTYVPNLWRKPFFHLAVLYIRYKLTRSAYVTDILLERI
jgi:hypothetical protein